MLFKTLPLENERDLWARVGLRFAWCTGPYFLFETCFASFAPPAWMNLFFLAIPFLGAAVDFRQLSRRARTPSRLAR
jgi:hypothetical protein